ncbi:hypothetical protein FQZ97_923470 [compost metagenome]
MCGDQVAKPGIAGDGLQLRDDDEQRNRRDDFRNHQRLVDEGIDEGLTPVAPRPRRRQRRHGGEDGGQSRRDSRDLEGADRRVDDVAVRQGDLKPVQRKATPGRHRRRAVEGVDHQGDDRQVEQRKAGDCNGREAGLMADGKALTHGVHPSPSCCARRRAAPPSR